MYFADCGWQERGGDMWQGGQVGGEGIPSKCFNSYKAWCAWMVYISFSNNTLFKKSQSSVV